MLSFSSFARASLRLRRTKLDPMWWRFFGWSEPTHWGAVEIGSSKIVVVAAEIAEGRITIAGVGETPSRGVRGGVVADCAAVGEALGRALDEAEKRSGLRLSRVFLSLSGAHVGGDAHVGAAMLSGRDGRVGEADWANALAMARTRELEPGRCVLHDLPGRTLRDGVAADKPAAERAGSWLQVRAWRVHAQAARVADSVNQLRSLRLEPAQVVLAGLASAHAVTVPEEREAGVLVIDLGAGTTDYALYHDGRPIHAGVLAVGGDHLRNDLAIGLRLRADEAEAVKRRHGRAQVHALSTTGPARVWLDDNRGVGARELSRTAIEQITAARARETLEIVRHRLGADYRPEQVRAGVVLTGGGAELAGLAELAAEVFKAPARIGLPSESIGAMLRVPGYATVLGTLAVGWELEARYPLNKGPGFCRRLLCAMAYVLRAEAKP